jgi:hypothetical protein
MPTHEGPNIITDGLVLCLDAADKNSYPTTGTTWTDVSGNDNNGTLTNGPTFDSANGGSIVFDGVNDSVQGNTSAFKRNNGEEITVSAWIRPQKLSGSYQDIVTNRLNTSYNWILYQHTTDGALAFHGTAQNKSNYIPTLNNWINVTVTVNSSQICLLYVNSSLEFTVNNYQYGPSTENRLWIGNGAYESSFEPYLGRIAIVNIYNRALSATEILQNYNATKSRFGL